MWLLLCLSSEKHIKWQNMINYTPRKRSLKGVYCFESVRDSVIIFIPPAYEVYRGYIVFAFSVYMFVCVCVC